MTSPLLQVHTCIASLHSISSDVHIDHSLPCCSLTLTLVLLHLPLYSFVSAFLKHLALCLPNHLLDLFLLSKALGVVTEEIPYYFTVKTTQCHYQAADFYDNTPSTADLICHE